MIGVYTHAIRSGISKTKDIMMFEKLTSMIFVSFIDLRGVCLDMDAIEFKVYFKNPEGACYIVTAATEKNARKIAIKLVRDNYIGFIKGFQRPIISYVVINPSIL